ncbi:DUF2509 family protein [Entomohabitans teleogrylli]|uniref:DUF2509 family protein n=1 Tax=Entomohabitans teleogrylli TaxID=1384589 RepID=UPI00073DAA53|nr:DUF2509 family protein [Entomohabitans teleogrylli]
MMPVLLLMIGTLMLKGVDSQMAARRYTLVGEQSALRGELRGLSALAWGTRLPWAPEAQWRCREQPVHHWRACLRLLDNNRLLLAAHDASGTEAPLIFWRLGELRGAKVIFTPRGWADFCPLSDERCRLP